MGRTHRRLSHLDAVDLHIESRDAKWLVVDLFCGGFVCGRVRRGLMILEMHTHTSLSPRSRVLSNSLSTISAAPSFPSCACMEIYYSIESFGGWHTLECTITVGVEWREVVGLFEY